MTDRPPSRLELLAFAERVAVLHLEQIRRWKAAEERRETERRRGEQARPTPPDWLVEMSLNPAAPPVYVHVGDCWSAGKRSRPLRREQAIRALADGVTACPQCRPDTALQVLE
ncbi:DUF6233 domain-containing protein [Streptomyces sp. NPDC058001]|uniref:DUF6233 domain-containing protein n=1 Tax=Streptomyces sp. NPDC058001 TaxID=3346300 RepID=UPI0036E87518